jgi:hypothetical protein
MTKNRSALLPDESQRPLIFLAFIFSMSITSARERQCGYQVEFSARFKKLDEENRQCWQLHAAIK